ncbi:transporter [Arthrobacter sp. UCD-GKA]|uniref:purine-cytosine permease family protein n=1 Tax=Arthrobacter sp. UCD-GKA TaxID=1913576 RepID=UPI0008DD66C6|nr:cytosine permease [Arthrobacter sp. UCD-GKA]OIH84494.1 transporter [Arthrobacter sp. UCD-GKA]
MSQYDDSQPAYGTSLTKAEPFATEEIPDGERHGHSRNQFTLWFAANMVLAVMVSGFFSSMFGLSVWQGLSAVAVGTLLGVIVMGVLAGIGTKLGVPQQVQGRGPMGFYANFAPITLLTIVSAIGWTAVNTVFAVIALRMLVDVPFWLAASLIFAVQSVFAIWGHNLVHLVNKIATVVLAILFAVITVLSMREADFSAAVNVEAPLYMGSFAGWATFAGFFFAYVMTWTPFASDFSRYLPRKTPHFKVMGYTAAGSFVAMTWLGGIGVLVSSFAGELDAIAALAELTGSWAPVAMITVVISTLPVSAMNLYGGSLSLLTIRVPVNRVVGVIIIAAVSLWITLLMQTNPYGNFYDFLSVLAYLVVPFSTILLLDYYLRMRRDLSKAVTELFDRRRSIEWGFAAWLIGCVVSSLFWNTSLWTGPLANAFVAWGDLGFVTGALASTAAYLLLYRLPVLPFMRTAGRDHAANDPRTEKVEAK